MLKKNNYIFTILIILTTLSAISCGQEQGQKQVHANEELPVHLIAHRGGVVDSERAENSKAAIEEAIRRGYWMLEVDLRKTGDGRIIMHHDSDFERFFDDPRSVKDLDWEEIQTLRSGLDGGRPLLFEEAVEMAQGRLAFMLDVKGGDFEEDDYKEIEEILEEHDLLSSTFVLSDAGAQAYLHGKASIARNLDEIIRAAERGENVSELYHLFELGGNLDEEMIEKANELGVKIVAAINVFRYSRSGSTDDERWEAAKNDIQRLLELGVEYYQVDSVYEPLFREG